VTVRILRRWIVLASLTALLLAALVASDLAYVLAGAACIGGSMAIVGLDGLRKRGNRRR
jgi:hypothetical protein